jgi:MFS family permease
VATQDRGLALVLGLYAASAFTWGILSVIVVELALVDLDIGEAGLGLLLAAASVGGIIGAVPAAGLGGGRRLAVVGLGVGALAWGLPILVIGAVLDPWLAAVAFAVLGLGEALMEVAALTLIQRLAPDRVLARVLGMLEASTVAALAVGSVLAPVLLSVLGTRWSLVVTGAVLPAAVLVLLPALRALDRRAVVADPTRLALLRRTSIFASLADAPLETLARQFEPVAQADGAVVVREGEPGDRFYVVESGELRVLQGGAEVRRLAAGDFFGEIALLRTSPRTATVVAEGPVQLLALEREPFIACVTGHAPSRAAAEEAVVRRLAVRAEPGTL